MARASPVNIQELKRKGDLSEKVFFENLSAQCNYVAPETVKDFYMGLVRHLTKELREKGVVIMPHLGYFALLKQKPRLGWAGKARMVLSGKYMLKFYPKSTWKEYFIKLGEKTGIMGALDPREKILNEKIE